MAVGKISVYICGSHCAGKTTLQQALQENEEFARFNFKDQEEIARNWIDKKGYTQEMLRIPDTLFSMEMTLLELQVLKEGNEVSEHNGRYQRFLWDRGILDCIVYTKVFCGSKKAAKCMTLPGIPKMLERLKNADDTLVVVPKPEREFIVSDGTRLDSDIDELTTIYRSTLDLLKELAIPHLNVNVCDLNERVECVLNKVKCKWPWLMN